MTLVTKRPGWRVIAATYDFAMLSAYSTAPGAAMARLFLLLLLTCATLPAQADEHTVVVKAAAPQKGCVEVELNGQRAPSMSCLSEKLLPNSNTVNRPPPTLSGAEAIVQRPSNQLGLYNRAALEHRMGNAFGKSVTPQRPPAPAPASPLLPAR